MENELTFTASEVCEFANVQASTLRAWRNRNGLFPQAASLGWTRYTLDEVVALMILSDLTKKGFETQSSVNLVNRLRAEIIDACNAGQRFILIDEPAGDGTLDFTRLNNEFPYQFHKSIGGLFLVLNIGFYWNSLTMNRIAKFNAAKNKGGAT